ncbi:hypothetical protein ABPG75_013122 [Micractinium tetrahymenae]
MPNCSAVAQMAGMVAAAPAAALTEVLSFCSRPPAPGPSGEEQGRNTGEPPAKRARGAALPVPAAGKPERYAGHFVQPEHDQAAVLAAAPGRPPRPPADACPLRQQQAAQAQAPLSALLLARLPRVPAAVLVQRHPLLPGLCSLLDSWPALPRGLGIPPQLHLPPAVIVEAAAWLLQLNTRSQAALVGRPEELCLVVAAAASANQQLHEQLARTMLLLKGLAHHALAQKAQQAQQQVRQQPDTGSPGTLGAGAAAPDPAVPSTRNIRTQLRARCWEHLQAQQPALAERLLSKLAARHAQQQQQRQTAERTQQAQAVRGAPQQQPFRAQPEQPEAHLLPAVRAELLEPASSSSDEPSASTASTASLEQQTQREQQEHESPASPGPATSGAADSAAALTPLERRVLQLLRSDAGAAARLERLLLAEQAEAGTVPVV